MGLSCSRNDPDSVKSKEIDQKLKALSKVNHNRVKLLLLGPGESGKSTIFKQMKILQIRGGFSQEELMNYKPIIYGNCVSQMKILVNAATDLEIPLEASSKDLAEQLLAHHKSGAAWSVEISKVIGELWKDKGIRATYAERGRKYHLNDTAEYFFENVERVSKEDYIPNQNDILRVRVRSTGIEEAEFHFEQLTINMVDVGGQRSERRKWLHCFDNVTAILFCAAISEYDQFLREDNTTNRMIEAILLFDEVSNAEFFNKNSIILFLNKIDLFEEKFDRSPLKEHFPDFQGTTVDDGKQFLKDRFIERTHNQDLYFHFTCALNSKNIQHVINCVREQLLKGDLNQIGI
uniref:Uncharacterized protein n=1 Tax=Arcella intermedia TaxID=1963864 RepID=A0A6B2L968_9EUKA|eukprot:TRINITY_DN6577_c0_g1_i1.p1 TRINITY_DN6577_c0_g1~~TRINITY_DN6577_c0_g1_i1.p1  ORF type:complete len:348 (+),score=57.86 TRINITY_DN6577_c0_g1_i1:173-1216(+)